MMNNSKTERTSEQHDITHEEFDAAYEDMPYHCPECELYIEWNDISEE